MQMQGCMHICLTPVPVFLKGFLCHSPVFIFLVMLGLHENLFIGALVWVSIYLHWVSGWGRPGTGDGSVHAHGTAPPSWEQGGKHLPMVLSLFFVPTGEDKWGC